MTPSVSSPQQVRHWRRGFWSLIITQFQGAFSDNALKYFVLYLLIGAGIPQDQQELKNAELGFLFSIPFILFSMAGGYLAAHYSKRSVTIATKVMELCVIGMAIVGLAGGNLALQFAAIFLIGTQAALFAPSKYGLLPELLPEERLSWGNGVLELGTFLAIITGTMAGALLAARYRTTPGSSGYILSGITLFGLLTSFGITRLPAAAPERSFRWNP